MKNILYNIIKHLKQMAGRILALFVHGKRRAPGMQRKSVRKPQKKTFWTKKHIIISASAVVLVVAVVLSVTLTALGGNLDSSGEETAYAPGADVAKYVDGESAPSGADAAQSSAVVSPELQTSNGNAPVPTTTPPPFAIQTTAPEIVELARGCHDPRIVEIQEQLMNLGYMSSDEPTDFYGYSTWYALQLFQRKHSLGVDGIAGDKTLVALFSDKAKPYTVKLGDSGSDIGVLQDRLISLDYLDSSPTGYFGTETETAVISFQERNGLYADGNIGEQTLTILYSDSAREARKPSGGGGSDDGDDDNDSSPPAPVYIDGDPSPDALIEFAQTKLGCDYRLGAKGPNSFDCSGFVYYCLNQIGYKVRYMTSTTWRSYNDTTISNMSDMQKGDIICFSPHHVGIYMGNGKMIDASSNADEVVIRTNILSSSYWTRNFVCAKRVF